MLQGSMTLSHLAHCLPDNSVTIENSLDYFSGSNSPFPIEQLSEDATVKKLNAIADSKLFNSS
jgi:hypothetical protein